MKQHLNCPNCGHAISVQVTDEGPHAEQPSSRRDNSVDGFVSASCLINPDSRTNTKAIQHAYTAWCTANGAAPVSPRALGLALRDQYDIEVVRSNGQRYYRGVALRGGQQALNQ